jgi:hypothetical protein
MFEKYLEKSQQAQEPDRGFVAIALRRVSLTVETGKALVFLFA